MLLRPPSAPTPWCTPSSSPIPKPTTVASAARDGWRRIPGVATPEEGIPAEADIRAVAIPVVVTLAAATPEGVILGAAIPGGGPGGEGGRGRGGYRATPTASR